MHALAVAKHDSINISVSKALDDNKVSDTEFKHITHKMQECCQLKESLRSNFMKKKIDSPQPDLEKIKNDIREEFRKKTRGDQRSFELKFEGTNTTF